jgi:hypothetical protein
MILLQGIEHFGLKSVAVGNDGNVFVLVSQGKGFKCIIVPSVQRHLLFVLSNFVKNLRKALQFIVTSSIKDCVFKDFGENTLLSGQLYELQILENHLGQYELGLSIILGVHASPLSCNIPHAVIISDG